MNKFKIGDKVRFRQDGEIGEHNELFNVNFERDYLIDSIHSNGNTFVLTLDGNKTCIVSRLQIEPVPEPQPKFANIKVGDWVDLRCGKNYQVKSVDKSYFTLDGWGCDANARYDFNGNNLYKEFRGSNDIVKILSPKEVVVDFGSWIVGTIKKDGNLVTVSDKSGIVIAWILISSLNCEIKEKVEQLLKAQEEACQ